MKINTENPEASVEITNRIKKEAVEGTTETTTANAVRTGDETPIVLYAGMAAVALLVVILLMVVGIRKKRS